LKIVKNIREKKRHPSVLDLKEVEDAFRAMKPLSFQSLIGTLAKLGISYSLSSEYSQSHRWGQKTYETCSFSFVGFEYKVFNARPLSWITSESKKKKQYLSSLVKTMFNKEFSEGVWINTCLNCGKSFPRKPNQTNCSDQCNQEHKKLIRNLRRAEQMKKNFREKIEWKIKENLLSLYPLWERSDKQTRWLWVVDVENRVKKIVDIFPSNIQKECANYYRCRPHGFLSNNCWTCEFIDYETPCSLYLYSSVLPSLTEPDNAPLTSYVPTFNQSIKKELKKKEILLKVIFNSYATDHYELQHTRTVSRDSYGEIFFNALLAKLFKRGYMKERFVDESDHTDFMYYDFTNLGYRFFATFRLLELVSNLQPIKLKRLEIIALRYLMIYDMISLSRLNFYRIKKAFSTLLEKQLVSLNNSKAYYISKKNLKTLHRYLFELVNQSGSNGEIVSYLYPIGNVLE